MIAKETIGIRIATKERLRQINEKGYTINKDLEYKNNELLKAANTYLLPINERTSRRTVNGGYIPYSWPFHPNTFKPTPESRITELKKAAGFIIAEIDRIIHSGEEKYEEDLRVHSLEDIQTSIDYITGIEKGKLSDGYHTFDELYEFRKLYNAALFNRWAKTHMDEIYMMNKGYMLLHHNPVEFDVHKSWKHNDGELCFGGGWFIVVAILPSGQISNHYKAEDWDLFKIPEVEKAKYPFDGHTSKDVLDRLNKYLNETGR